MTDNSYRKIRKRFWMLIGLGFVLTVIFFGYGTFFDIWEKDYDTLPKHVIYFHYIFIVIGFTYVYVLTKFAIKYDNILTKKGLLKSDSRITPKEPNKDH